MMRGVLFLYNALDVPGELNVRHIFLYSVWWFMKTIFRLLTLRNGLLMIILLNNSSHCVLVSKRVNDCKYHFLWI